MSYAVASSGGANTRTAGTGAVPSLDLDERSERARALRQWRSADVEREHIGIAVTLGLAARRWRIEPCAGGHDCDARHHVGIDHHPGETCATRVKHAHDVTVADIALRCVRRAHADGLAFGQSCGRARRGPDPSGCGDGSQADASRGEAASVCAAGLPSHSVGGIQVGCAGQSA